MNRPRVAALLLLALAAGAQAHARPGPWEPPSQLRPVDVPEVVLQKRAIVKDPQADALAIASAATTLLEHRDIGTLRDVLAGEAVAPVLGVLAAVGQAEPERAEALLEDVVALAARVATGDVRTAADKALDNLVGGAPGDASSPRQRRLLNMLDDPKLGSARRVVVLRALGRSENLAWVEALIVAVGDGNADQARLALTDLTGHDPGPEAGVDEWRAWWAENKRYTYAQLLARALKLERERRDADKQQSKVDTDELRRKVVAARIDKMGDTVPGLVTGLGDEYAEVRLEAARRLGGKANDERASGVIPDLLRRLGPPGGPSANGHADAAADEAGRETDPRVCAALVTAVGVLGRNDPEVRAVLIAQLKNPTAAVSAAAAQALEQFRNQPGIVQPLIEYLVSLPRSAPESVEARVKALLAIAANAPAGVIGDLLPFVADDQPPSVRAAAVRAVMACEQEIGASLQSLVQLYSQDASADVHFAIAASLGDRLASLPADADPALRTTMVGLLGNLLSDTEANVRLEAAAALGRSGADSALPLLERRARVEADVAVQKGLITAAGALRQAEGARVIGELIASHHDTRDVLLEDARKAVAAIAGERSPQAWLDASAALSGAGAHELAAFCCSEVGVRFGSAPEHRDAVERAGGQYAVELLLDGQAQAARTQFEALERADAPLPPRADRQLHLAEACRLLQDWSARADWLVKHLGDLPAADARRGPETLTAAAALSQAGRHAEALPLLRAYVEQSPTDNQALFDLVGVEEALGQFDQALHDLDALLGRLPDDDALREQAAATRARLKERTAGAAAPTGAARQQLEPAAAAPGGESTQGG